MTENRSLDRWCLHHRIRAVGDDHALAGIRRHPPANERPIRVGQIEAVFLKNGFNVVRELHVHGTQEFGDLWRADLKFAFLVAETDCPTTPTEMRAALSGQSRPAAEHRINRRCACSAELAALQVASLELRAD